MKDVVEKLIENGSNIDAVNQDGYSALLLAANNGKFIITYILFNFFFGHNNDFLSTKPGFERIVRLLIEKGVNINDVNQDGDPLIVLAAGKGNIISLLVLFGSIVSTNN